MRIIWTLLGLIVLVVGIGFALLNTEIVSLHYYLGAVKTPLSLSLVLAFVLGGLIGLIVGYVGGRRAKHRLKNLAE